MKKLVMVFVFILIMTFPCMAANLDTMGIGAKATSLGGSFCAYADGPYAVYYNPAGLTQNQTPVVSGGLFALKPTLMYDDLTVTRDNAVIVGPQSYTEHFDPLYIPHFGAVYPLSRQLVFGIAAYLPYGMELKWSDNTAENPAACSAFHSRNFRTAITPAMGYKINDILSIGAGVSLGRSEMVAERVLYLTGDETKLDLTDDFNYSFNLGVMCHPEESLFIGLTFRSRTKGDFDGDVIFNGVDSGIDVTSHFDTPEQVQGGVRYVTPHNVSLSLDLTWTRWSIHKEQVATFSDLLMGYFSGAYYDRDWDDTVQIRMGVEWHVNNTLDLRAGYFYDPSPVPDNTFDFAWPDADRKTFSVGTGLHFGNWTIDSVVMYISAETGRQLGGESSNLNGAFNDMNSSTIELASIDATGHMWACGVTFSYSFSR